MLAHLRLNVHESVRQYFRIGVPGSCRKSPASMYGYTLSNTDINPMATDRAVNTCKIAVGILLHLNLPPLPLLMMSLRVAKSW